MNALKFFIVTGLLMTSISYAQNPIQEQALDTVDVTQKRTKDDILEKEMDTLYMQDSHFLGQADKFLSYYLEKSMDEPSKEMLENFKNQPAIYTLKTLKRYLGLGTPNDLFVKQLIFYTENRSTKDGRSLTFGELQDQVSKEYKQAKSPNRRVSYHR